MADASELGEGGGQVEVRSRLVVPSAFGSFHEGVNNSAA